VADFGTSIQKLFSRNFAKIFSCRAVTVEEEMAVSDVERAAFSTTTRRLPGHALVSFQPAAQIRLPSPIAKDLRRGLFRE